MFNLITRLFMLMSQLEGIMLSAEKATNEGGRDAREDAASRIRNSCLDLLDHCAEVSSFMQQKEGYGKCHAHAHGHTMSGMELVSKASRMSDAICDMKSTDSMIGGVVVAF